MSVHFTDKIFKDEKIILFAEDKVVTAETDLAKLFKDSFEYVVEILHIQRSCKVDLDGDLVVSTVKNFSQHRSILKIKENTNSSACFSFYKVSKEDLLYQLNGLDPKKLPLSVIFQRILFKNVKTYFQSFFLQTLMPLF